MKTKYFEHLLGNHTDNTTVRDILLTKDISDSIVKDKSIDVLRKNQHDKVKLEMEKYLQSHSKKITSTGEFLNKLFNIYNIKKSTFARHIGYDSASLYALLIGKRKFNTNLASKIGKIFKINPEVWLYIEAKNDLKLFNAIKRKKFKHVSLKKLSQDN